MIYVDTGAFLARYLSGDQYHKEAVRLWNKLEKSGKPFGTSNGVVYETLTLLARRAGYGFAAERARNMYSSESLTLLRMAQEDEWAAIGFFEKYADKEVSFIDCVSFALMRRTGIEQVFTFDRHFEMAGFHIWSWV